MERTAIELKIKVDEVEKLRQSIIKDQCKLHQIDQDINELEAKREQVRNIDRDKPFLDLNNIGDTIEIENGYTNFSMNLLKSKRIRRPLERGSLVAGYHTDKFGEVTHL